MAEHIKHVAPLDPITAADFVDGSLSKHPRGFVPVVGELRLPILDYRRDRFFVQLRAGDQTAQLLDEQIAAIAQAGHPVLRFTLPTLAAVATHVACWQVAVVVAGVILGLNPYDEPDTVALRTALRVKLSQELSVPPWTSIAVTAAEFEQALSDFLKSNPLAAYVALVLYVARTPAIDAELVVLRSRLGYSGRATLVVEPLRDPLYATQVLHAGRPHGLIITLSA